MTATDSRLLAKIVATIFARPYTTSAGPGSGSGPAMHGLAFLGVVLLAFGTPAWAQGLAAAA